MDGVSQHDFHKTCTYLTQRLSIEPEPNLCTIEVYTARTDILLLNQHDASFVQSVLTPRLTNDGGVSRELASRIGSACRIRYWKRRNTEELPNEQSLTVHKRRMVFS
jgi:hypothetical protein